MNLIIKGDTSGVVEAIRGALSALPQDVVVLRYLLSAAGDISTSDIDLAAASSGMVLGFNLEPDEAVLSHAKRLGVTINTYRVIYNLIDDVKAAMEGKLRQVEERVPMGTAKVKAVFGSGKKRVAGCEVRRSARRGGGWPLACLELACESHWGCMGPRAEACSWRFELVAAVHMF